MTVFVLFHRYPAGLRALTQQPAPYLYAKLFASLAAAQRYAEEDFAYQTHNRPQPTSGPAERMAWGPPHGREVTAQSAGGYPLYTILEDDLVK